MTDPDGEPSYKDIAGWSSSIAGYWKHLAGKLDLPGEKIQNVAKSLALYPSVEEQALEMLEQWRQTGNATYRKMAEALRTLDKGDLADKICPPQGDSLGKAQHEVEHSPPATPAAKSGDGRNRTKTSGPILPPQNVRADSNGLTSILVKWDEVPWDKQHEVIEKYEVVFKDAKTGTEKRKSADSRTKYLELTALESFRRYDISVVVYTDGSAGPASPVVTVMTGEQEFGQIRQQLAEFYVEHMSKVQVAPWDPDDTVPVDDVYTRLSWSREERDHRGTNMIELKDYTDIFISHDHSADPSKIVVFGQGGIGKSTFTQKLSVDWARRKQKALKRFDLVVVIRLRDLRGDESELKDIIVRSKLLPSDDSAQGDHLHMYMKENQARVLILFDGFDEYDQAKDPQSVVNQIVRGEILRDCHIVVTTRPERLDEVRRFMQTQCKINGFTHWDIEKFATKYVGEDQCPYFMNYLKGKGLIDMASIPLMLLFLCLLWKEKAEQPLPSSRTDQYQRIVQCIVDHCEAKRCPGVRTDLDKYHETLCKIGKVAFEALLQNSLVFDTKNLPEDVLREDVVRLGFLSMSKVQHQRFKSIASFFHKSIQEFLAAWYISKQADISWTLHLQDFDTIKKLLGCLEFSLDLGLTAHHADAVLLQLKKIREKESNLVPKADKVSHKAGFSYYQKIFQNLSFTLLLVSGCKETSVKAYVNAVGGVVLVDEKYIGISESVDRVFPILVQHKKVVRLMFTIPRVDENKRKLMRVLDDANVRAITWASGQSYKYVKASVLLRHIKMKKFPCNMLVVRKGTGCCLCCARGTLVFLTPKLLDLFQPPASHESHSEGRWRSFLAVIRHGLKHPSASENNLPLHVLSFVDTLTFNSACTVDGDYLAWILRNSPHLIYLFSSHNPGGPGVSTIAAQLQHLTMLQDLNLSNTRMTEKEGADLSTALVHVPHLRNLNLSGNPLGPGMSTVAAQLQHLSMLQDLNLSNTRMTEKEGADLSSALVHVPYLRNLNLSGNPLGPGMSTVVAQLQHLPKLQDLNLSNTRMTEKEVADMLAALAHIPWLGQSWEETTLKETAGPLKTPVLFPFLKSLNLCGSHDYISPFDNSERIERLKFRSFPDPMADILGLRNLDLSDNPLGPGVSTVAAQLQHLSMLRNLNLSNTQMTKKEAADMSTGLVYVLHLENLNLSGNPALGPGVSTVAAQLRYLRKLKHLNLSYTQMTEKEVADLSAALVHVPNLTHLNLSVNPLGPSRDISTSHQQHLPNLDESEVPNTHMTETDASDLSTALVTNLDLSDGPRVQHGVISLAEQIVFHVLELCSLDLRHTGIHNECETALKKANEERCDEDLTYGFRLYLDSDSVSGSVPHSEPDLDSDNFVWPIEGPAIPGLTDVV